MAQLGFKDVILFNDNDFFQGQFLKEELAPQLYLYYLRDYLIEQPYFKRNGKLMEQALIRKADYVFTNSTYLNNYAKQYNASSAYVGQGTNLNIEHANQLYKRPIELEGIHTPIVGYIGNLVTLRLDLDLLENVVPKRKDLTWVFVGPLDKAFEKSKLRHYKHVLFTGPKSQSELPHYISSFDVCINPQLLNKTTIGNYPRKVDEYMLFGKPVVARKTDFTEELGDLVYAYKGEHDFLLELDSALAEQDFSEKRTLRKKTAQSHTWENSVNSMFEAIGKMIKLNDA
jgi:glycosyltransferase involved in cell wall biosynthesis